MTASTAFAGLGTPGQPWGDAERAQWRSRLVRHRRYADDVVPRIERLRARARGEEPPRDAFDDALDALLAQAAADDAASNGSGDAAAESDPDTDDPRPV